MNWSNGNACPRRNLGDGSGRISLSANAAWHNPAHQCPHRCRAENHVRSPCSDRQPIFSRRNLDSGQSAIRCRDRVPRLHSIRRSCSRSACDLPEFERSGCRLANPSQQNNYCSRNSGANQILGHFDSAVRTPSNNLCVLYFIPNCHVPLRMRFGAVAFR